MKKRIDITGNKYGKLTVLEMVEVEKGPSKAKCICECGKKIIVKSNALKTGNTKSCGCLKEELKCENGKKNKRYNKYIFKDKYGICISSNGYEIIFDIEDYDKIKYYYWYVFIDKRNYKKVISAYTVNGKRKNVKLCNLVKNTNNMLDHINRNSLDNRKSNLRECTQLENTKNKSIAKNNTSGISGVSFHKKTGKWQVKININKKEKYFGIYDSFEEAKIKRLKLEIKYYGEFAPNKELYERYGLI